MRARRVTSTSILSDAQVREVVQGVRASFGPSFTDAITRHGIDLEDGVRFSPLAKRCAERREELGQTIKDAAAALQVPQYRLKAIESGHPKGIAKDVLQAYVVHLGLEAWYRRWAKANPEVAARCQSEGRSRTRR